MKKPWYIWLSLLAYIFLWGNTASTIAFVSKGELSILNDGKRLNLWLNALKDMFLSIISIIFIPIMILSVLLELINDLFTISDALTIKITYIVLYLLGVHLTYRHAQWREKNLPKKYDDK